MPAKYKVVDVPGFVAMELAFGAALIAALGGALAVVFSRQGG